MGKDACWVLKTNGIAPTSPKRYKDSVYFIVIKKCHTLGVYAYLVAADKIIAEDTP